MFLDFIFRPFTKDPTLKRHIVKSLSWRFLGTIDTVLLGFIITGKLSTGIKIGGLELFTKILLYFFHERIWHVIRFGQPAALKRQSVKETSQSNLVKQSFSITRAHREQLNGHPAFTIWLTGLSGSGKSTLASSLDKWLHQEGVHSYVIDGDNTRMGINNDLNFSREGREENIRRVAEIAKLFNDAGVIMICSFISPFIADRQNARQIIGHDHFVELYVSAPLDTCIQRDAKGLYKKAMEGQIKDFTGVNSPYEAPINPDILIDSSVRTIDDSLKEVTEWLKQNKLLLMGHK